MKILTKEEEDAHYRAVVEGGTVGTVLGLIGGWAGVLAASRRFNTIRSLTLPMKAFLMTSSGTFVGIVAADHTSRAFEAERNQNMKYLENREERLRREELAQMSLGSRIGAWAREEKYKIIGATWVASIVGSFALVGRNPYLSGQQKIVQARVYAQGLTLAVMCASAAFEIHDQRKGRGILDKARSADDAAAAAGEQADQSLHHQRHDENTDLWQDMVAAEEEKLKQRHKSLYSHEHKEGPVTQAVNEQKDQDAEKGGKEEKEDGKEEKKEEKDDKKDEKDEKKDDKEEKKDEKEN